MKKNKKTLLHGVQYLLLFILLLTPYSSILADNGKDNKPGCHQGDQDPPKPDPDPNPDPDPADSTNIRSDAPVDPNEIIGPDGWMAIAEGDTVRWVSASQSLPYTIYFENDPERATAAAQVVTVRLKMHPLMNMADFGVGTFGFGNHVFPVEGAPLQYQTRLDLTEEMNLYVDVVAGIDITTNEAFWIFSSIDPATGVAPTETDRGFLAVNDSTHIGEGYVTFSIKPKADLCHTGDTISAQASIVFDINDPIETNRWVNTVDAVPPVSMATVLTHAPGLTATPSSLEGELDSIRVVFSGADDATGMAAYRLYYTENGSAFRLAGRYTAGDTAVIAKQSNTTYTFFSLGEDNVGNIEPMKGEPDTLFGNTSVRLLASVRPEGAGSISGTGNYSLGDTANISVLPAEGYRLLRWTEGGIPQGTDALLTIVAEENHTFTAELERISYPLTVNAAEGTTITATTNNTPIYQEVRHFDTLDIHIEASPCYGEVLLSLNNNPLTADTTIVVHEAVTLTSTATQQVNTGYVFDTVCRYTAYTANGFNILSSATGASGTFNFQLPTLNLNGCDSIAKLSLYVKPSHTITFLANGGEGSMPTQQICDGEETVLNGSTFTREGYFFAGWATIATATTAQYADGGIITLNADQTLYAVWSSNCVDRESNRMVTVCDSYMWNGETQTESGDYMRTVSVAVPGGCDSIYHLHLTVKHSTENLQQIVSCQPYTWVDGQTYATDTVRQLSMTNAAGCDSIVTLNLSIFESIVTTESVTACDSYEWHGTTYTASTTTPTYTTTNSLGCDSVVTLHLTIFYSNTGVETMSACNSLIWHGTEYFASTNTPTYTSTNAAGCDSVTTLHLTIIDCSTTEITACDNYTWHGVTYTSSGTYMDGTDTLVLTLNYSTSTIETVTACDSYTWHGTDYSASNNTATFTETNASDCDSVVTLNLTVNHSDTEIETVTACNSYVWHGVEYTASTNMPTFTTTNANGCDSVTTLHLTITYCSTTEISACDSFTWHGNTYTISGTYFDGTDTLLLTINYSNTSTETVTACDNYAWHGNNYTTTTNTPTYTTTNAAGCDSTVTLNLTVNYSNTGTETVTACDSYDWHGSTYTASNHTATFTTTNAANCDSVTTLNLTINYSSTGSETVSACDSYEWHGTTYTASGTPVYQTTNAAGCDSTVTLFLTINHSAETTVTDTAEGAYTWHGTTYSESGTYQWQGTTEAGCDSTVTLILYVYQVGIGTVVGDGIHVRVYPNPTTGWLTIDADDVLSIQVFDQSGREVASHVQTNRFDLGGLPVGSYLLKIQLSRGYSIQKVLLE